MTPIPEHLVHQAIEYLIGHSLGGYLIGELTDPIIILYISEDYAIKLSRHARCHNYPHIKIVKVHLCGDFCARITNIILLYYGL